MIYDFDQVIDRRCTDSEKWKRFPEDVLPLWVADMDFRSPEPVTRALLERVSHGIFGYGCEPKELILAIIERMQEKYQWQVRPEEVVLLPGVVAGFNLACQAFTSPGEEMLSQVPVYEPILRAAQHAGLIRKDAPLLLDETGRYQVDLDAFEGAISDQTRIFLLCNPHNPVGRVFDSRELSGMAEICLRHDLIICSDEIHCDMIYPGSSHRSIASLSPEVAALSITLMAPSKTYNIAGLGCAFAIIPNPDLRLRFNSARKGMVGGSNVLGLSAALAAYQQGGEWLDQLLRYLQKNRDILVDFIKNELPGMRMDTPEGTYLAWLDCRKLRLPEAPQKFFLNRAHVALVEGELFGPGGEGFVRLNFGCPRPVLLEALARMRTAILSA